MEKLSESKAHFGFIKEARRQAMIEALGSSSAFMEGESSQLVASEPVNIDIVESKAILERLATPTEPLHQWLAEASTEAQGVTQSGQLGSIFYVVVGVLAGIREPPLEVTNEAVPLNSVPMANV